MNYSVSVPHNTWTDIYTAIGVAVGTQLVIENTGAGDVLLSASASQPTVTSTEFNVLRRENGIRLSNKPGASGAWVNSHGPGGRITVYVEDDPDFYPYLTTSHVAINNLPFDAFGRLRSSDPLTLFDSKQIHSNQPLYWDDQEVSGTGTTSTHSEARASTTIGVAATTAGKRVRQTYQRFNYQPGKSQLILCTGVLSLSGSGISVAMGYFDDANGIFVSTTDGVIYLNIRSSVTGSPVDNSIAQSNWNGDKLDGTGASGYTLNANAAQIFWMDIEWLGVGTVKCGFVINGEFIVCHSFHHANSITSVYMSTPNLPVRYEIENDGTGAASTLEHICSTVISEGGQQANGQLHYISTDNNAVTVGTTNYVALVGIRLQSNKIDQRIDLTSTTVLNSTKAPFEWRVIINPTVAGNALSWADHTDSSVQETFGDATNTVSGGKELAGGIVAGTNAGSNADTPLENALRLGASIAGVSDQIFVCVKAYGGGGTTGSFDASLGWRELT